MIENDGRLVGTRTADLYRVKGPVITCFQQLDRRWGTVLSRVTTAKPELLQVIAVDKFRLGPQETP